MRKVAQLLLIVCLVVVFTACESRTDRTDSGGVLLSITDFDGLPISVSVNATAGFVQVEEFKVANVAANPNGLTSNLMNVEIVSYEVLYSRADRGTRVPTKFVRGLFGVAPVNGEFTVENLPVMGPDQLSTVPLSDLLFDQGGIDTETGESKIALNFSVRFFGRTLSGDAVETNPALFTVEFTP
jgi:hypothetical protein